MPTTSSGAALPDAIARPQASPGYLVTLASFDIASFSSGGQTIQGARAFDASTNALLWSIGPTFITGATASTFTPGVAAQHLALVIDLAGLGTVSDNIGIDNVRFGQTIDPSPPPNAVPEPATLSLIGIGLAAACRRRRHCPE